MATSIKVWMKNGEVKDFPHKGRPGGSYSKSIRYENGFVVIIDEWYNETVLPSEDILEIKTRNSR